VVDVSAVDEHIALRDFGLMLGAHALGRLALAVYPARKRVHGSA
jgi:hypothetical protein